VELPVSPLSADSPELAFPGFLLDLRGQTLRDEQGRAVELRPQAYAVLRLLALHAGSLVTKDQLVDEVWPNVVVTDDSLVQAIGDLRHALGKSGRQLIKTVPRRGYMLVGATAPRQVRADEAATTSAPLDGSRRRLALFLGLGLLLAVGAAAIWWLYRDESGSMAVAGSRPSIAVLAFRAPQPSAAADAVARDVAANLADELARSPDLRVVATQSSFQLDALRTPLGELGRRLRSRYLVDGTVRREGEQLQVTVELLDSGTGRIVWSSPQVMDRASMGVTQQALVSRIAGTLQSRIAGSEEKQALTQPPKTLDVFVLTAQGKALMQRYNVEGVRESRRFFEQALAIDPDYAPAWAFLGMTNMVDTGLQLTGEWNRRRVPEFLAQIQRAVALEPEMTAAYVALSHAQGVAGNFDAALAAAQRCRQLSPNEGTCFYALGSAQLRVGQMEAAVVNLSQAMDRNPLPPAHYLAFYATALWSSGRLQDALRVADECLSQTPDFWRCRQDRIAALVELGRLPEARDEVARLHSLVPQMTVDWFGAGFAEAAAKYRDRRIEAAEQAGFAATAGQSN
jgi:DNA-binding winged helix-turn-helix (wHTH) protein/TolB-like protein